MVVRQSLLIDIIFDLEESFVIFMVDFQKLFGDFVFCY